MQSHQNIARINSQISIRTKTFVRHNIVFIVSLTAALLSAFFVPPDTLYFSYFDLKTLVCLFSMLAVICALRNIHAFTVLAKKIIPLLKNTRLAILGLVYITLFGSMLITNDMALITFLPLSYFVLTCSGKEKYLAFTFIMQNFAANLGGMITPFGNPQNLYLYSRFNIPTGDFIRIMLPHFLFSVFLITVSCLFIRKEPLSVPAERNTLPAKRTLLYLALFVLAVTIVFKGIPYWLGFVVIFVILFFADRKALLSVDYPLLLTFVCFFIFAGNMARIGVVQDFFSSLLEKSTLLSSVLSCQVISNVPAAILLSQFTDNYRDLLVGVNIGGTGTMIASLASLITFKEYLKNTSGKSGKFTFLFSVLNIGFLLLLTLFAWII